MTKTILSLALSLLSTSALAGNLDQFAGRYKVNGQKCSLNKFNDFGRAYVTIQGLKKNVVNIQLFGSDAQVIEIEVDNKVETSNGYTIKTESHTEGSQVATRTSYARNGKITQVIERMLKTDGRTLTVLERDSQMPAPVMCELVRN